MRKLGEKRGAEIGRAVRRLLRILAGVTGAAVAALGLGILDFLSDPEFFRNGGKPRPSTDSGPGKAALSPSRIIAGRGPKTISLRFQCGPGGISEGGGINMIPCRLVDFGDKGRRAVWMFSNGWGLLQNCYPRLPNYFTCEARTSGAAVLEVESLRFFPWRAALRLMGRELMRKAGVRMPPLDVLYFYLELRKIKVRIRGGRLQGGDEVIFILGDTRGGSRGWSSPAHPSRTDIVIEVDEKAMGQYRRLAANPVLEVVGGEAVSLQAVLSSEIAGEGRVTIRAVDGRGDVDPNYRGRVEILPANGMEINGKVEFGEAQEGAMVLPYRVEAPGVYEVKVNDGRISGESNPMLAGEEFKIFWGDMHMHTALCDGLYEPGGLYREARDRQGLDFGAITTHDTMESIEPSGREEEWELIRRLQEDFNQPGRFAVFLGYEWSNHKQGHRGIYFAPDEADPRFHAWVKDESNTPEKLEKLLADQEVIIIPHHTAWRRIWVVPFNWLKFLRLRLPASYVWFPAANEQQRLVEIYSMHGSSEGYNGPFPITHGNPDHVFPRFLRDDRSKPGYGNYIQEALAEGLRLGIIAGSDRHDYAMDERTHAVDIYPGGLTAVWADDLTAESLWRSLWNRRCYGTTGARIFLQFSADGLPMGTEYFCASNPRLEGRIIGTAPLEKVELLRHDQAGYRTIWSGGGELEEAFGLTDDDGRGEVFYYLRVEQEDGHCAWSSPIWVRR